MGETAIDAAPLRVVTPDTGELDAIVELGPKPSGVVDDGADGSPRHVDATGVDGVDVPGTIEEPIRASPVWKRLSGAEAGAVHTDDDQTAIGGIGYHAAFAVMGELDELVAR